MSKPKKAAKKRYDQERIVKLWESGKTFKQIAEALGCSQVFAHRVTFGLKGERSKEQTERHAKFVAARKAAKERENA